MEQNDFFAEMKAKTPFNPIHSVTYRKLSTDLDSYWDFSKWTPVWTNSSEGAACNLFDYPPRFSLFTEMQSIPTCLQYSLKLLYGKKTRIFYGQADC